VDLVGVAMAVTIWPSAARVGEGLPVAVSVDSGARTVSGACADWMWSGSTRAWTVSVERDSEFGASTRLAGFSDLSVNLEAVWPNRAAGIAAVSSFDCCAAVEDLAGLAGERVAMVAMLA
jgi:hypothetical protein